MLLLSIGMFVWMKRDNRVRDEGRSKVKEEDLVGMSEVEIEDLDWRHPRFRWRE